MVNYRCLFIGSFGYFVLSQLSNFSRKILIASANALFREGLHKFYAERWNAQRVGVVMAKTMQETLDLLDDHQPDLVIVDHDDNTINRDEFLNRFVTGEMPMKVILVVIYNRKQLTAAQAEDWLANPWDE